ncbi:UDP-2-acetamido-2-deoxy-3-oxo-D-glucuronate aminotransferase [Microbacterium hydrocarbonoxydans]|uniref:UDP-2-acetamido-2-deoxy-3-oxo-D-glucuronate aminotransferase n=1 Tax=Microbacterium hydrocarbonoxydans TaxID=273678 RepID=A0A0M2HPL7_9MICO|nr:DegT/DnrJ/EryC1/StrS family aminotransferase [Microbacterium hydrocarbonoxydans]KJL46868.1 UDP-2-acetamido-2-deoxy-3-oxo-D-glucuronate aminotransferase [Microbacterium hydrocarbonoxydans]
MIPISTVRLGPAVEAKVLEVIRSGNIAQGPVVAEFENRFAELVGARHAVAVNNGTTALVAAIQSLGLEPGDEVITSPFTFIATLNAILEAGATVRFGDIRVEDFALDPESVRAQITDRTKAIIPVHLYGQSADMKAISAIAAEHSLAIIEDGAQAHGARFEGKGVGTFGIGCFSFYATKNLTTGEGGIITTDDDEIAATLRIMRNQGMRARYEYVMAGHNYRLTDLQAAVVIPQLDDYAALLETRRANAAALSEKLSDIEGLVLPAQLDGREHVWHQYTVLLPQGVDREAFVASLAELGIGSGIYYPKPVYDYDTYRDRADVIRSETPVADDVAARCVSLPVHQHLADGDIDTIAAAVRQVLAR